MTTTLNDKFENIELIPPNPAAIDFEQQFRSNLQSLPTGMLSFETEYLDTVLDLKGGDANLDLSTAITDIREGSDHAKKQILDALITGTGTASASWDHNGSTVLVGGALATGLDYASLSDRFNAIDTAVSATASSVDFTNLKAEVDAAHDPNISGDTLLQRFQRIDTAVSATASSVDFTNLKAEVDAAHDSSFSGDTLLHRFQRIEAIDANQDTAIVNAFTMIGDGTSNHFATPLNSIQERFFQSEDLLEKAYTVKQDTTGGGVADTITTATSIENRFSLIEDQIAITGSSLTGYALLAGDSLQDFSAQNLTVTSNISFTNPAATLTGLQTATIYDLTVSNLLTLNQDPTNSTDAVRLSYAQNNFAKLTGLNTQTFEVLTDDSRQTQQTKLSTKPMQMGALPQSQVVLSIHLKQAF